MGLFVLASIGLSMYIWSMTLYNVYKPLSSTLSAATPSPLSFFNTLFTTTTKEEPPKRQGRKRKNLTLAEAQREQLRESLKVLFIWLTCKGTEPVFDYTFGYIVPFYNPIKVLVLLVFARFRSQLSIHLFDSFIIPLGRPNTPLINSTAFTTLILPWLRFMLSLPFAHLFAAFRNTLNSLLDSWGNDGQLETPQEDRLNTQRRMLEADRVPPPKVNSGTRQASTSSLRKGSGPSDGMGGSGGGNSLRYQRSMDSLSSKAGAISNNKLLSSRQRSISSRMTPGTQETFQQLQSLPAVPNHLPEPSIRVEGRIVSGPAATVASSPMKTFAHIPGAVDLVPPPDTRTVSHLRPSLVERMPGSLASSPVKAIGQGTIDETVAGDHTITAANLVPFDEKTLSVEAQQEKPSLSDAETTLKTDTNTPSKKKATSKRKVGEIDGELSDGREAKLKASPGKKTTRGRDVSTTTSASRTTKSATKKNSDATTTSIPRSRSKRTTAEEPKVSLKIPRTRRGAT